MMRSESRAIEIWMPEEDISKHGFSSSLRESPGSYIRPARKFYTAIRRSNELRGDYTLVFYEVRGDAMCDSTRKTTQNCGLAAAKAIE